MGTKLFFMTACIALLAITNGGEAFSEPAPLRVTKCQLSHGSLYFGPSPPPGCETIAVYENGKEVNATPANPSPTPNE